MRPAHDAPPGEPASATAAPRSAAAVPPAVPDTTVDASEYREDTQAAFAEHDVSERARRNATGGPVHDMRQQEEGIDRAVDESANRVRDRESAARRQATNALHTADEEAAQEMTAERERAETQVGAQQDQRTTEETTDRQTVTERIEGMYNATATFVNGQITQLTQNATTQFDTEQATLLEAFKTNTRRDIAAYKSDRYSTPVVGWGRWLKDKFVSINNLPRVKAIYRTRRQEYVDGITGLIDRLTQQADAMIALCRLLIVTTRVAIDALVAAQGPRYAREAAEARDRVNQQFQQLERQVEAAGRQVRNALETRRERAIEAVDQALAEIQAENASLVDRLVNFVKAIYNALKQFFALMVRIEEMGIGTFLRRALDQAKSGVKNHLWNELKAAFQEWLMMKLGPLGMLLNLPSNFLEILMQAAMNLANLFLEALPEALPALGVAAMTWLAIQLAAKLIPGAGAIMAVIDAIRAAWSLIQSLIRAASAFFDFLLLVAGGGDGSQAFARALAWGIIAAVDALLTFLGVDSLLRRIAAPIGRPMGRILGRLRARFARRRGARGRRRGRRRDDDHRRGHTRGDGHHQRRTASGHARATRRAEGNRRRTRNERRAHRDRRAEPRRLADQRRRRDADRRRRRNDRTRERVERVRRELPPRIRTLLARRPSTLRLRAQLAYWRVSYRLRSLQIVHDSRTHIRFRGVVNPPVDLGDGWEFDDLELMRAVDRVAERFLNESEALNSPGGQGTTARPVRLDQRNDFGRVASQMNQRAGGQTYRAGISNAGEGPRAVGFSTTSGHLVTAPRPGSGTAGYMQLSANGTPSIMSRLEGVAVGDALGRLHRREALGPMTASQREAIGELYGLWFGREGSRGRPRRDFVYSGMLTQAMERNPRISLQRALIMHPSVMEGAQQGARGVDAALARRPWSERQSSYTPGYTPEMQRARRRRREIAVIRAWFRAVPKPALDHSPTGAET